MDIEDLVDRIDRALVSGQFDSNNRLTGLIALEMCEAICVDFDSKKKDGVLAARRYWEGGSEEDRMIYVNEFSNIIDDGDRQSIGARERAANRLVWSALNTNTGLSSYTCEFLIGLGADAGLTGEQMEAIFSRNIPGL